MPVAEWHVFLSIATFYRVFPNKIKLFLNFSQKNMRPNGFLLQYLN